MADEWHTTNCLLGVRLCRCDKIRRHNLFRDAWSRKEAPTTGPQPTENT